MQNDIKDCEVDAKIEQKDIKIMTDLDQVLQEIETQSLDSVS